MKEMLKIIKYSAKLWPYYMSIAFFVVILSLLSLATPFLTKGLIDGLTTKSSGGDVSFGYFMVLLGLMLLAQLALKLELILYQSVVTIILLIENFLIL